ncbi:MAG: ATP-binding protein [Janthinobacterium lividum]
MLWLCSAAAQAQVPTATGLPINRLPAGGLLLQNGWRYQAGDNPAWARPDFDDSHWAALSPARPGQPLPTQARTGSGWFRLRFRLGDSLRRQSLLLHANQTGAMEVYLDGQLLPQPGTLAVGHWPTASGFIAAPTELPLRDAAEHVVAARLVPWQSPLLFCTVENSPLLHIGFRLLSLPQYRQQVAAVSITAIISSATGAAFLLLVLLHLAFFSYNPAQRANLYFALYTCSLAIEFLGFGSSFAVEGIAVTRLSTFLLEFSLLTGLGFSSSLWVLRAMYELFGVRPGREYVALWVICPVALLLSLALVAPLDFDDVYFEGFWLLITLAQLRVIWLAWRAARRGVVIIGTGFALSLVATAVTAILGWQGASLTLAVSSQVVILFLPALCISLFLAREFALDSKMLQVKLGEIERLSAQTLAQEQDKQALLAQQNETLEQQVAQRTHELQHSLTELQRTQAQLIQQEKMASLGELTAGIAHEIQNPLNFVNNFAEVSTELLDELAEAQARPTPDAALETELVGDLRQNLTKIAQHGQRASSIVRGMLAHSRANTSVRAPTDLNALCDEYLRLAYHGLRAKDKTFNASLQTDFLPSLPPVEGVGADLGRVLLNLFTNAFYAVQKRQQAGEAGYQPTVRVATAHVGPHVEIRVSDNGTGMPERIRDKIFQPFFTTKPPGEGTGLGLSLAHEIVTKGHSGTLTVDTAEGQGTTFIITLPA